MITSIQAIGIAVAAPASSIETTCRRAGADRHLHETGHAGGSAGGLRAYAHRAGDRVR